MPRSAEELKSMPWRPICKPIDRTPESGCPHHGLQGLGPHIPRTWVRPSQRATLGVGLIMIYRWGSGCSVHVISCNVDHRKANPLRKVGHGGAMIECHYIYIFFFMYVRLRPSMELPSSILSSTSCGEACPLKASLHLFVKHCLGVCVGAR